MSRLRRARRLSSVLAIALAVVTAPPLVATASSNVDSHRAKEATPASVVAQAVVGSVPVYDTPGAGAPSRVLQNPTETDGQLVFLVDEVADAGWLEVLLPVRPNGSVGWIRAEHVSLAANTYRIVVRLDAHRLKVFDGDEVVMREPVGIGTRQTPTPGGRYYVTQLFEPPDPGGAYGPFAYALSGFSEVLETFQGGDAIIGIHGTNRPDLVGSDVSHGCIRMKNDAIERLATMLPLGTPVTIRSN